MADYYSILSKTISGLAHNSQGTRDAIYGKARTAIERQLRAMDPVPSEEAIARQMQMLEAAIARLDGEYAAMDAAAQTPQQQAPAPTPAAPIQQQPPAAQPPQQPAPPPQQTPPQHTPPAPGQQPGLSVSGELSAGQQQPAQTPPMNEGAVPPPVAHPTDHATVDPRGMDYNETILASAPDTDARINAAPAEKKKSGLLSTILAIVLAFAVVGGGLYALWINKDALIDGLIGDGDQPIQQTETKDNNQPVSTSDNKEEVKQEEPKQVRVVGEDSGTKNTTKLTSEGETVNVEQEQDENVNQEQNAGQQNVADQDATDNQEEVAANNVQDQPVEENQVEQKVVELGEDGQPKVENNQVTNEQNNNSAAQTPESNVTPAVAQKAFLYEEGTAGSNASRDNAAVIWSLEREPVEDGSTEPVIKGQLDVPGRDLSMTLLIKRNRDEALPASHIIELVFQMPKDFSGGNISDVSRFVMKTSEQGRGEGLIAVPAKISDGNFLIALNNLEQALATNNKLMLDSSWIDVPLGYTTGRRALVTLEKGALGDKVFRDAFAEWATK